MGARGELAGVGHRRAGKTLVGRRRRVNAQWNGVGFDLVEDESVKLLLDLRDAGQLALPVVVERSIGSGLELPAVLSQAGRRSVTTVAHARVVAQPALVQVRVVQRLDDANTLLRVEREHLAKQVHGFVRDGRRKGVQRR